MLTQVGIQHLQLLQVRPAVRRHLLQPGNQFLGKDIRPFLEGAEPAAEFLPVRLRSLRPAVLEGHGRRDDGRNEFPRRRHHHFPDQRREIRHRPGIMDTAFLFPDGKRLDVGGVTDNLRPLRKIEPVAGFHQFHPLVLQRGERRETDDTILVINRIVVCYRERVAVGRFIVRQLDVIGQAGGQGEGLEVMLADLRLLPEGIDDFTAETAEAGERVRHQ